MSNEPPFRFSNEELSYIFETIANLLEIKGEVVFKTLAYRKAADSLLDYGGEISHVWQQERLTEIPGIGKAIAEKINDLFTTGEMPFFEKLKGEVPITLVDLLEVPDVGPKKVALFWNQLGITTLPELETAARDGRLSTLPGMGKKSESKVIAGIEALKRRSGRMAMSKVYPFCQRLLEDIRRYPGVTAVEMAGSLRRMRSTVGDLDLVVAAKDSAPVMDAFSHHPDLLEVLARGDVKCSVEFRNNIRAQLWVYPPERYGTGLLYATGSKDHNVRLRELAIKKGLSLSDAAFLTDTGDEILCADEGQVYSTLDLPWIPPELREDKGEVQAGLTGTLPRLIEIGDMRSELHAHTNKTDGTLSVMEMAVAARSRGRKMLAITDHTVGLGVAGGLSVDSMRALKAEIDTCQVELGESIRLLWGAEVEIKADGSLDYTDDFLAEMDIVIASLHASLSQPREQITQRLITAMRNPHVDLIGHPTGRILPNREGADLDMDAVLAAAAENKVALEINAHPSRLDLDAPYARRAVEMGIVLSINTDAHSAVDLDLLHFGVATARRGWVEAEQVLNTWDYEHLTDWLQNRR